ncbi:MAG: glycosyltransferase family 87 protein [Candidatus Omnitrophica bacterium]|nr:glycosyltransferase family 87 protein [Candidatus Omnitrophota bacterium]MDD5436811.1 glycosyltransferase family 87 protein [Candidatus Omnitrophota bacterium]
MSLKKIWESMLSDKGFLAIMIILIVVMAVVTVVREGKDLKVGLYGVTQMLQRQSPYDNPTDANRPIFRYAPAFTLLQAPFLLTSKVVGPYQFEHMLPSVFCWYVAEILAMAASVLILMRLIPAVSAETARRNLRISIFLALPLIGYEISNSQNKLIALAFLLFAIYLFEKNRQFLSAVFLSIAMTIYIPLAFFAFYFIFRSRGRYIVNFILGVLLIFVFIPSLIWGAGYNNFLLKDWYMRCLKPFAMTTSYTTYMELRPSSQSLPSAIARMFIVGRSTPYRYILSPEAIHALIRICSTTILAISLLTVWKKMKPGLLGLSYAVFLPLSLIMPSYCIWYTWAYLFVLYFAALNYMSYPDVSPAEKRSLKIAVAVLLVTSYSIAIGPLNDISVMFWGTVFFWGSAAVIILKRQRIGI